MLDTTNVTVDEDDFLAYEFVRQSGMTNMMMTRTVSELSGLTREQVMYIIKNYGQLKDLYLKEGDDN